MDRTYLNVLKKRKVELQKELDNIDSILFLYSEDQDVPVNSSDNSISKKEKNVKVTNKDIVLQIINDLGGKVYVSDVSRELQNKFPKRDVKAIKNLARNYIHILKNDKVLESELEGNNKWVYRLVK